MVFGIDSILMFTLGFLALAIISSVIAASEENGYVAICMCIFAMLTVIGMCWLHAGYVQGQMDAAIYMETDGKYGKLVIEKVVDEKTGKEGWQRIVKNY